MVWFLLLPVAALFVLGSVFSYRADLRALSWFVPVYVGAALLCALVWVWCVRSLNDNHQIFVLSLVWDLLMVLCYYLLPLALFEVKFDRCSWAGFGLMLAGMALIKVRG